MERRLNHRARRGPAHFQLRATALRNVGRIYEVRVGLDPAACAQKSALGPNTISILRTETTYRFLSIQHAVRASLLSTSLPTSPPPPWFRAVSASSFCTLMIPFSLGHRRSGRARAAVVVHVPPFPAAHSSSPSHVAPATNTGSPHPPPHSPANLSSSLPGTSDPPYTLPLSFAVTLRPTVLDRFFLEPASPDYLKLGPGHRVPPLPDHGLSPTRSVPLPPPRTSTPVPSLVRAPRTSATAGRSAVCHPLSECRRERLSRPAPPPSCRR